jgi:serine/threonine protein kinase
VNDRARQIVDEYRTTAKELLYALGRATADFAADHPDFGLAHEGNYNPPGGLAFQQEAHLKVRRDVADGRWIVVVGFATRPVSESSHLPAARVDEAIDWAVTNRRPPISIPVTALWAGQDAYGRSQPDDIEFSPIIIEGSMVRWERRHWPTIAGVDARWIVERLFHRSLLHKSAEEARAAQRDGRWMRTSKKPHATGGQGVVWQVRDRDDPHGPAYAKKELRWPAGTSSDKYRRFVREIEIVKSLSHPNIVHVVDYFIPDGDDAGAEPFYVTPWADMTVAKATWLKGNVTAVLKIGVAVSDALCAADEKGVTHRDVKPDNILLRGDPLVAELTDFGIAHRDDDERLTETHDATVGSDDFVPPEARGGRFDNPDSRFDVYSLGKSLLCALGGWKRVGRWSDPRYDLRRELGAAADVALSHFYGVIERMVAESLDTRFASIHEARAALVRALDAVTRFEPYREGMYSGGPLSPSEVRSRVEPLLAFPRVLDWIGLRNVLEDAVAAAESAVQSATSTTDASAAREAAEYLLAVLVPLVGQGDERGLDLLLTELWQHAHDPTARGRGEIEGVVRRAARAIAFYGAATVAWANERWAVLRKLAERHAGYPDWLLHLDICGGAAEATWDWIQASLTSSKVLRATVPRIADRLGEWIGQAAGVLALHVAYQRAPEQRATTFHDRIFPAFITGDWMDPLARRLERDRELERQLAGQLFTLAHVPAFREFCRDMTPSILKSLSDARVARRRDPSLMPWEYAIWARWCGSAVRQPA